MASDASHFLLTPCAVVVANDGADVGRLLGTSARLGVPLTLRLGGTSLSGQGVTDGILVDVRARFRDLEVLDDGARVRVQPGSPSARSTPGSRRTAADSAPIPRARLRAPSAA